MCERDKVVRRTMKVSTVAGVIPTVPETDNHRDGSWIETDIYKGELFFNQADGIMYTRGDSGIIVLTNGAIPGAGVTLRYKAKLTQTGTDVPDVVYQAEDEIGGTFTYERSAPGEYFINNPGKFPISRTCVYFGNEINGAVTNFANISFISEAHVDDSNIYFNTFGDGGTAIDEVLLSTTIIIEVLPEIPVS